MIATSAKTKNRSILSTSLRIGRLLVAIEVMRENRGSAREALEEHGNTTPFFNALEVVREACKRVSTSWGDEAWAINDMADYSCTIEGMIREGKMLNEQIQITAQQAEALWTT